VLVKDKRNAARQVEAVYALVPQRARREARDSVQRAELQAKTATALLRQAERNYGRVVREGRPATPPLATTKRLRLTPAEARALTAEINKLVARHSGTRDGARTSGPWRWCWSRRRGGGEVCPSPCALADADARAPLRSGRSVTAGILRLPCASTWAHDCG